MNKLSFNINVNENLINKKNLFLDLLRIIFIVKKTNVNSITLYIKKNHIFEIDINIFKKIIKNYINLKIEIFDEMLDIILKIKPKICCFILKKKKNNYKKSLNIIKNFNKISIAVNLLNYNKIQTSLFINPDLYQIDAAINTGVKYIELNTIMYSKSKNNLEKKFQLNKIKKSVIYAKKKGLIVNVGNNLNYDNIKKLSKINQINEFNIGNSIIKEGIYQGLNKAIKKMLLLINTK
ncbi:pyridoxine 5'-phosphate synthase [Enterobacteriaceae bacterium ET-AT1-13]|nr:pyridoxine 5'-phosphate synthase [Enterobacteriaceae bacterium ET-AT1-13]WGS66510.1 pyridoxine 5'-phosphate synthase [Enterobacteriaceae bacterium Cmel17]WMC17534.1 MAG: pyridoxine 5'-phosphate synthase [Enterobacteriaceae bacterium Cmel21]WMC17741.1 MAG: pyridoxine 5'-phosphate synthase [Enterobacteriaceae bacterium PSmelAO3-2]WMC17945.1 MAG: pyridoxine 5'-phosphate synthase [Enterobacteriaceae bacterium PSmelAO3-1]WMC18147.1 MAG: pyridoxine 5'-phosphate synthase [Enterobacteriaceae bacter